MVSVFLWFLLFPRLVSSLPCTDAVERQLVAWNATPEVLKAPGGPLGGDVYRIATNEIGVWITVHQPRGLDIVSLFLTNADGTQRLDFGKTCAPKLIPSFPGMQLLPEAFTDELLKKLLAEDDRLVVYLWSPHLPLSVEGYHEIVHAASSLGIPFVAVVDGTPTEDLCCVSRTSRASPRGETADALGGALVSGPRGAHPLGSRVLEGARQRAASRLPPTRCVPPVPRHNFPPVMHSSGWRVDSYWRADYP